MGAIVDLVNLVTQLTNRVQDRKITAELMEIQKMIASIQTEQAGLHEQRIKLMTENSELKQTIESLNQELLNAKTNNQQSQCNDRLPEPAEKMLIFIASNSERITQEDAIQHAGLSTAKGAYLFDKLLSQKYIAHYSGQIGVGWFYKATPGGREYLAINGLLE